MTDATPTPGPLLTVQCAEHGSVLVIALDGELDLSTVHDLEEALEDVARPEARVCLDLAALGFIDSTGLAAIIRAHMAVEEAQGRFVVVCVDGPVRRIFETTGLSAMLVLASSRASALRDLSV